MTVTHSRLISDIASADIASTSSLDNSMPTSAVILYAGNALPTPNWLQCNGQAVSRTTYSGLFSAIGTTYGSGDGSTTFNVPTIADAVTNVHYLIRT